MNSTKRLLLFAVLLGCAPGTNASRHLAPATASADIPTPAQKPSAFLKQLKPKLDRHIDRWFSEHPNAALVVGLTDGTASLVLGRGRTNSRNTAVPGGDTVFLVGSVTKVFTGLLFASQVVAGKVRPNDFVQQLLPQMPIPQKNGVSPTLTQLATHTSGLPHMFDNIQPSQAQLAELLREYTLTTAPGEKYHYSNIGYALLGKATAQAGGQSYQQAITEHVADPLGMTQTDFMGTNPRAMRAQGYNADWSPVVDGINVPALFGCCVLESTANDLLRLAQALLRPEAHKLQSALQRSTVLVSPRLGLTAKHKVTVGGLISLPNGTLTRNGIMDGYRTSFMVQQKSSFGVVVLANQTQQDTDALANRLLQELSGSEQAVAPTVTQLPTSATPTDIRFANGLQLIGYEVPSRVALGTQLKVSFFFRKTQAFDDEFKIFVHGDNTSAKDRLHGDHYPPTATDTWPLGQIMVDHTEIQVPSNLARSKRTLFFGLYSNRGRLQVIKGCNDHNRVCGPSFTVY